MSWIKYFVYNNTLTVRLNVEYNAMVPGCGIDFQNNDCFQQAIRFGIVINLFNFNAQNRLTDGQHIVV